MPTRSATPLRGPLGRWRDAVHERLARVPEVGRVLMKPRNGTPWTADDRVLLRRELRAVARDVSGLVLLLLPGGLLWLPLYAWLLDRRRAARRPASPPGRGA